MSAKDVKFNTDARNRMMKGVNILADLPGPQELKAQLLMLFNTPATNMVRVLNAPAQNLLNVLNAKKDKDQEAA